LKAKQKIVESAQFQQKTKKSHRVQEQAASGSKSTSTGTGLKDKGKAKGTPVPTTAKPVVPFKPTDKILLVGEGNFSFARALTIDPPPELVDLPPRNVTATAYDTEEECYAKYADAEGIVKELRAKGVNVLFGVDATKLGKVNGVKGQVWDRIVFNFPHAGESI